MQIRQPRKKPRSSWVVILWAFVFGVGLIVYGQFTVSHARHHSTPSEPQASQLPLRQRASALHRSAKAAVQQEVTEHYRAAPVDPRGHGAASDSTDAGADGSGWDGDERAGNEHEGASAADDGDERAGNEHEGASAADDGDERAGNEHEGASAADIGQVAAQTTTDPSDDAATDRGGSDRSEMVPTPRELQPRPGDATAEPVASSGEPEHDGERRASDRSARCRASGICDTEVDEACIPGPDARGCVSDSAARRAAVVDAIRWAFVGYEKCAWGQDELRPVSCSGQPWMGLGVTLVDSLDTFILAGLHEVRACSSPCSRARERPQSRCLRVVRAERLLAYSACWRLSIDTVQWLKGPSSAFMDSIQAPRCRRQTRRLNG